MKRTAYMKWLIREAANKVSILIVDKDLIEQTIQFNIAKQLYEDLMEQNQQAWHILKETGVEKMNQDTLIKMTELVVTSE